MSDIQTALPPERSASLAIILPFRRPTSKKTSSPKTKRPQCIFCSQTMHTHSFKGQTVCAACLSNVPDIFAGK